MSLLQLSVALGALGLALSGAQATVQAAAEQADKPPVACELKLTETRTSRRLEAIVTTTRKVTGSYALDVGRKGSNRAMIKQSGEFSALPGEPVLLGEVTLDRSGEMTATLDLHWSGKRITCRTGDTQPKDL